MFKFIQDMFSKQSELRKIIIIVSIIWFLCSVYLIVTHWDIVLNLNFNDNDDFMRFYQYREWIKNGNWYLEPMPRFNPDGVLVMHWSRLADIPLAILACFLSLFFDLSIAFAISNTLIPLIYLFIFLLVISFITYLLFGFETAKIAMLIPLISPLSSRFLPGALDHHNLQFIFLALFILFSPLVMRNRSMKHDFICSLCMILSLWVGLENIYSFVFILFLLTLYGYLSYFPFLFFCRSVCFISVVIIPIFLILNRPFSEFFEERYDVLSFPLFICFISALIFCLGLSIFKCFSLYNRLFIYISMGILVLLPIVILYPDLLKGGYANYPERLKFLWLDNVSEAISIFGYMRKDVSNISYFFAVFMSFISLFFFRKGDVKYRVLYVAFLVNFILAFFWQVRMFSTALVCCIPLQAYTCFILRDKIKFAIGKSLVLILSFPSLILFVFIILFVNNNEFSTKYDGLTPFSVISLLNKHEITERNILAPVDLGAPILAGTDNTIISAPYHRNIQGNLDVFDFFLFSDNKSAKEILEKYSIDYVLLDGGFFDYFSKNYSDNSMLIKLFKNENIPAYLEYIGSNGFIKLYKYKGDKNE
ncbi:hypothetical protein ABWH65_07670 [Pasteurella multocida]|uniref:hypothetical protein n=1 Tax=Pasteurella multocida TaxID=747 RepID=UPI003309FFC3|nr:hypothetical protein [Pasteurella multocida]